MVRRYRWLWRTIGTTCSRSVFQSAPALAIKKDTDKLLQLATELKQYVDKTNAGCSYIPAFLNPWPKGL